MDTPGATPNGAVNPRLLTTVGSTAAKHSTESLMEYIKKQKLIIKKKQAEIDALAVAKQTSGVGGDGAAGGAVLFERLKPLFGDARRLRSAFSNWLTQARRCTMGIMQRELEGQVLAYAASEKRVAKLKALLARTHSANQKNIEDSKLLKKEQQMSKEELTQLKAREESELKDLQEVQRATSLESAFQYDTDRKIAEAVAAFIANRPEVNPETATPQEEENEAEGDGGDVSTSGDSTLDHVAALSDLTLRLATQSADHAREMSDINALRESLEQRMNTLDERNRELKEAKAGVENTLKSENALRRELELELDQLIMDRSRMVNEGRVAKGMRERVTELEKLLTDKEDEISRQSRERAVLEEECKVLRKGHTDVSIVEGENVRLHAIVKDFTRRGGFLQSGTKSKMSSSSSTLAMVPVEGGARTVDQLVETVNGVLATDACVLGADAYESIAILDDELSILRSCLVGLGERSRTSRYSQYLMDDNLTPLCVGNRVRDTKEDMHSRVEGLEEQLALVDERIVSAATHLGAASSGSVSIEDELAMKEALENQLEVARASLKSSSSHELERKSLCTSILSQVDYLEASKRRVRRSGDGGMRSRLQSLLRKFGRNDVDSSQPGTVSSTPTASTCYSAEDVVVPAADDLKIPISSKESVKLSWQIKVKSPGDVGFAVMRQRENSSLEFMNEYSRVMNSVGELWLPNQTGSTVTWLILLDNSFSWMRQKNLSYKVVVETFSSSGDDEDGDSVGEQASAITPKASSTMDIYRKTTAFLAKMVLDV